MDWRERITVDPAMHHGRPTIRGMRISVQDVLDYLGSGMSIDEVLSDFPDLTPEDIQASIAYAAEQMRKRTATA
ncbi:MAG: DUF433 domain-containing protein [Chloroflexi bacterium]|nr:DUF433 domain-containing protein [Chloroflexota bacterium]